MKISFFFDFGPVKEIGTGHKYRTKVISEELVRRQHKTDIISDGTITNDINVLIIDHIKSQKNLILQAKSANIKIVLIDGAAEDVPLVDLSISAFINDAATYKGEKYICIPTNDTYWDKYSVSKKSNNIFVAMGGYDYNNYAELIIKSFQDSEYNLIIAKSINHPNYKEKYPRVEMFEEEDYYTAMRECVMGIVNGGLTLLQCLYFGLPCIAIAQYEHQKDNINAVQHCCLPTEPNETDIKLKAEWFLSNEYYRNDTSRISRHFVDGKGAKRICDLIEGLG